MRVKTCILIICLLDLSGVHREPFDAITAWKCVKIGPSDLSGSSAKLPDAFQLVKIRRARQDGFAEEHLAEHAADKIKSQTLEPPCKHPDRALVYHLPNAPHINLPTILTSTKQQLWRTIPPGDNAVRVLPLLARLPISRLPATNDVRIERAS